MTNKVRFLGHAAFEIVTSGKKRILIDPWITGNPLCSVKKEELKDPDLILITHDHADHIGEDVPFLVEDSEAIVVTQPELLARLKEAGVAKENFIFGSGMNIGGTVEVAGIKVTMVQASHSAGVGSPCGFIITTEDGKRIYHAGDTGVFAGMKLLGEIYPLDLALLPIGSVFVMDPLQAAWALEMLNPRKAVPMHYKTFPVLVQDAKGFVDLASERAPEVEICVLEPGQLIEC
jgi:L-ascorbate metabolism protein UlaG (beta-lactamase superfamily)